MSEACTARLAEPAADEPTVHEWLRRVRGSGTVLVLDEDPLVARVCAAAVDPLEVAAGLETVGISQKVVNDEYGMPDVFALADEVWGVVPFQSLEVTPPLMWRRGNVSDLFRGALYAAPALMLLAVNRVVVTGFGWWVLPLAITWGWALGQVTAHAGYGLRARVDAVGEGRLVGWVVLVATVTTVGFSVLAERFAGGGATSVVAAAGMTLYMVASAVLLLNEEEYLGAVLLVPGAAAAVVVFAGGSDVLAPRLVVALVLGSGVATLVAALRHVHPTTFGLPRTTPIDRRITREHLLHGLVSGIALSLIAILGVKVFPSAATSPLVALPLLLTLGVMEWQLRTFRAAVEHVSRSSSTVEEFAPAAWRCFARSVSRYLGVTVAMTLLAAWAIVRTGHHPPVAVLAGQVVLGTMFFVDLVLVSLDRLDLVLRSWTVGSGAAISVSVVGRLTTSQGAPVVAWCSAAVGVVVVLIALVVASYDAVRSTLSH